VKKHSDSRADNENLAQNKRKDQGGDYLEIPPHINNMLNFFKSINEMIKLPNVAIVTDNIRPQLLFEDSKVINNLDISKILKDPSRKGRNDDDIIQIIESYTKELNKVITGTAIVDQTSKYLQNLDQLTTHIDELLKQNDAHIRLPADFDENKHTYHSIPLSVVKICLKAFSQKYDDLTEAYHGLELARTFLNSYDHAYDFVQGEGLEKIYQLIIERDGYISPFIKLLALEILNMCLSYDFACERFLNFDLSKLETAMQPEVSKEKEDKEKKKKSKSKVETPSRSRSRSRSRSSKRSKKKKQ